MSSKQIMIKPNLEVFSKMGINTLKVKNILLNTRNKKIIFDCIVSGLNCIKEIDIISKNVSAKFGRELEVEFLTENICHFSDEDLKVIIDRAIERLKVKNSTSRSFLCFYKIHIKNNKIVIELNDENAVYVLNELKINFKLESFLAEYGVRNKNIHFLNGNFSDILPNLDEKIENAI
ncbi:MAG: PolC-type DNA polymerase III, partial [Fusobacterium sp.]|nr:PolC-type DNA polymerase III [Fusobacterium sp.]